MRNSLKRAWFHLRLPILAWIGWMAICGPAWAEGRFNLNTYLDSSWRRDDNFYLGDDQEREVDTYAVSPGLIFGYGTGKSAVDMDYRINAYYYDDRDPLDETTGGLSADDENYQEHILNLKAESQITRRLMLRLTDGFFRTRDPAQSDAFNNTVDRDKYIINRLTPEAYYALGEKFGAGLKYQHTVLDYAPASNGDQDENRGIGSFHYNPNQNLNLYLEYQYWQHTYSRNSSDYDSSRYSLNFKSSHRLWAFTGGLGHHQRRFDDPGLEEIDTVAWNLGVAWGEEEGISYLRLKVDQDFNDAGAGDNYYTALRWQCDAGYRLMEKIDLSANATYQTSDYEVFIQEREDDTWLFALKADYLFREYLIAGLEYGVESRDSNLAGYDYDNRFIMVHIKLAYDWGAR